MFENDFMTITVAGVGCGGNNSVCRVADAKPNGITYYGIDTDKKALRSSAVTPIHLGANHGSGRGCGGNASLGKAAAEETMNFFSIFSRTASLRSSRRVSAAVRVQEPLR